MSLNKSKIEWTDYSWNPIRGLCPVGCWYCYARRMYKRFGWKKEISYEMDDMEAIYKLQNKNIPDGSRVFICSTFEIFHPSVKKEQVDLIFQVIGLNPKITFIILTKLPENIDREMPDNVWLGVSVTCGDDSWRVKELRRKITARIKFISFEPLFSDLGLGLPYMIGEVDWVIVGRLTQFGKKHDPDKYWIQRIIQSAKQYDIPVFMKDNLKNIWPGKLIQEYPK